MRRAFKFLLRPTKRQVVALTAMLEDHRTLYNAALQERRDAYRMKRKSISYYDQCAQLPEIRANDLDQSRWACVSHRETLRVLDRAFSAFFRRVGAGQKPGYPRFKSINRFNQVVWSPEGNGCKWLPDLCRLRLMGIGHVRVHQHRSVVGRIKTVAVKREGNRWYVVLSCVAVPAKPLCRTGAVTGIDLGIASFLTTSGGQHLVNPRYAKRSSDKLAEAQRTMFRRKRTSTRRRKAAMAVEVIHRKIVRQRLDHAHKTALDLVCRYDVICHEALSITNMTRSAKGTVEHPGKLVAQKSGLNRSILDVGWGAFLSILTAKAESAGRTLIAVNPRNTSRTCTECGHCCAENRVTQANFICVSCGYAAHADVVAAVNILRAGLVLHAAQAA